MGTAPDPVADRGGDEGADDEDQNFDKRRVEVAQIGEDRPPPRSTEERRCSRARAVAVNHGNLGGAGPLELRLRLGATSAEFGQSCSFPVIRADVWALLARTLRSLRLR